MHVDIYIIGFSIGLAMLAAGITMMKIGWDKGRDRAWRVGSAMYIAALATWILSMILAYILG